MILFFISSLLVFTLLASSYTLGEEVAVNGIYFCRALTTGEMIKWHFVIYSPLSEEIPDLEMPNNTDITLTIVQDLANVNFVNIPCQNFTEYFNLKYGNITETFEIDDPLYLFLMPIKIELSNGTEYNPCKSDWIYAIFDDIYYAEEENKALTITIKNDIVVYDAWLVYPDEDAKIILKAEINYRTGIMQYLNWKYKAC